jgi:hypothetical protein
MKHGAWLLSAFAGLVAMIGIFACGKRQTPTSPGGASVTSISITSSGPLAKVGQTAQLTALEKFSDGSTTDVTAIAVWTSNNPKVVTISATGLATVIGPGTATITASLASVSKTGSLPIIVTAVGTSQVTGHVWEPGLEGIPNAEVTLIGGAMDGRTTTTDPYGNFNFFNVSDALQIRAMRSGYITATQNVAAGNAATDITLSPTVPYADVGGTYHVTFTASPSCQLPDDVKTRAYSAAITQDNARLTIIFSGPLFTPTGNLMEGRIYSNAVNLRIGTADDECFYYHQCFVENLPDGRAIALNGTASGTVTGSTIDTQVAGVVNVTGASPATCTAPDHHLTFSR